VASPPRGQGAEGFKEGHDAKPDYQIKYPRPTRPRGVVAMAGCVDSWMSYKMLSPRPDHYVEPAGPLQSDDLIRLKMKNLPCLAGLAAVKLTRLVVWFGRRDSVR